MSDQNLSLVLHPNKELKLEDTEIPQPRPNEVQVALHSVGICGSDVHFWKQGFIGDFVVKAPMILGHEASGTVSALGDGVTTLKIGDRVAMEPGVPCSRCSFCKSGRYNLCPDVTFFATPPIDGSLRRYLCHAADYCFKLPDHVTFEEGAFLEPLSVAVQACRRGGVTVGDNVLICGAGAVGLVNMMTAKAMGAASVCITDISESRLQFAKKMGADATVLVKGRENKKLIEAIHEGLGVAPDVTIECSGAEPSVTLALTATRSGGVVVVVGLGGDTTNIPLTAAGLRELDIRGVIRYANCYPTALSLVASGKVDLKSLVTHRFTLEQSMEAFNTAHLMTGGAIKVMIKCSKD